MSWIGLDLGGTKIFGVVLHGDEVTQQGKTKTPQEGGPQAIVDAMAALVDELGGIQHVEGIGIGAPGLIDRDAGVLRSAPNLVAWEDDFPLGPAVAKAVGGHGHFPVGLGNDVYASVLGEHLIGAARGHRDVLGIWMGTGVGGGLVLDGHVRRGAHGLAGEIGHTIYQPGGLECGCGGRGHLEAYAGRAAMERRARAAAADGRSTMLVDLAGEDRMKSSIFEKALLAGDAVAVELIDEAVAAVATTVASLHTLLDLELVVLGGGVGGRLGPQIAPRIEELARSLTFAKGNQVEVVPSGLGDAAGAVGAALMVQESAKG
ncbi:MAG TPA: ROK family protein [Actinomycetota bacterium]|nr:ROK family protein [Actinomycetota bacterium]